MQPHSEIIGNGLQLYKLKGLLDRRASPPPAPTSLSVTVAGVDCARTNQQYVLAGHTQAGCLPPVPLRAQCSYTSL